MHIRINYRCRITFQGFCQPRSQDFLVVPRGRERREASPAPGRPLLNSDCMIPSGTEEVGQLISELSRELSTNEIALFSIVLSAEFGQKNLHSMENKSEKNINIKIFLQNIKCCSTTTKDLLISAKICEVNFIFNVILMFEVSRLPTTC